MVEALAITPPSEDVAGGLRVAMRRLASGVAIITAPGADGPIGMAATSVTSLSLDPPSILFCVNRTASLPSRLDLGVRLGVALLSAGQGAVAAAFGSPASRAERFATGDWVIDGENVPKLRGSQANLVCLVDQLTPYGTHTVVIARVSEVAVDGPVAPLVFYDGRYL